MDYHKRLKASASTTKDGKLNAINVSREAGDKWKTLPPEQREYWDTKAKEDRQRYCNEKAAYDTPRTTKTGRLRKDPSAPKRFVTAFLIFSQRCRKEIKMNHPTLTNGDVSSVLGHEWRNKSPEEKRPYVEQEQIGRAKYHDQMMKWRSSLQASSTTTVGKPHIHSMHKSAS